MKKHVLSLILVIVAGGVRWLSAEVAKTSEFIVAPSPAIKKNMSVNTLKEHIGDKTKQVFQSSTDLGTALGRMQHAIADVQQAIAQSTSADNTYLKKTLHHSASYNRAVGSIQSKISLLQQKCSLIAERLLDNTRPFKKASKKMLEKSLLVLTTASQQINSCLTDVQQSTRDLKKIIISQKDTHSSQVVVSESVVLLNPLPKTLQGKKQCTKPNQVHQANVLACMQKSITLLQAKANLVQKVLTSFTTDECLKNI